MEIDEMEILADKFAGIWSLFHVRHIYFGIYWDGVGRAVEDQLRRTTHSEINSEFRSSYINLNTHYREPRRNQIEMDMQSASHFQSHVIDSNIDDMLFGY